MDDAAKAAKRAEIQEKVAAMQLEQKKLEVGIVERGEWLFCNLLMNARPLFQIPPTFRHSTSKRRRRRRHDPERL